MKLLFYCLFIIKILSETKINFNYYHTSNQIDQQLKELVKNNSRYIKEVNIENILGLKNYSLLNFYDITDFDNINNTNKTKIFLLGGEHPRELISVETLFHFIKKLLKSNFILQNFYIRIIINANPYGRIKVENGEFCLRQNLNYVDINRNWNIFWNETFNNIEENPGNKAFSEIETKFILKSIENFNPKLFLSVHSGIYGLFLPYAFKFETANKNTLSMLNILNMLKTKYCKNCLVGPPSKLIGYRSSGTCLDYIYDFLNVSYSFAFEIYSNQIENYELKNYKINKTIENSKKIINYYNKINNKSFLSLNEISNIFNTHKEYTPIENELCINIFNPIDYDSYEFIINNWSDAFFELLEYVNKN